MVPPAQRQVGRQVRGASSEVSSTMGLPIPFSKEDWRNPTPKEKRIANAMCSGVISNEHAQLLRSMKSFAEEHDMAPDDAATARFVIGIMRMLDDGRLVSVGPFLGQGQSSFALLPRNGNVAKRLTMNGLSNDFLDMLLASCIHSHQDGSQSDASSTLASEGGVPEGYSKLQGRRVETIDCDCQGECHHMSKPGKVPTGRQAPTDMADVYQDERTGGRLGSFVRSVVDCLMSIFGKVSVFRTDKQQQDVERNTAAQRADGRDKC